MRQPSYGFLFQHRLISHTLILPDFRPKSAKYVYAIVSH
jgi:hypothetical protein